MILQRLYTLQSFKAPDLTESASRNNSYRKEERRKMGNFKPLYYGLTTTEDSTLKSEDKIPHGTKPTYFYRMVHRARVESISSDN
jgi:hypothetical protein